MDHETDPIQFLSRMCVRLKLPQPMYTDLVKNQNMYGMKVEIGTLVRSTNTVYVRKKDAKIDAAKLALAALEFPVDVEKIMARTMMDDVNETSHVTQLMECCRRRKLPAPSFQVTSIGTHFEATVQIGTVSFCASASSKKSAKQYAAKAALDEYQEQLKPDYRRDLTVHTVKANIPLPEYFMEGSKCAVKVGEEVFYKEPKSDEGFQEVAREALEQLQMLDISVERVQTLEELCEEKGLGYVLKVVKGTEWTANIRIFRDAEAFVNISKSNPRLLRAQEEAIKEAVKLI